MLKILHARLQHYANQELPDGQAGFRKGRWTRDQSANIHWIMEKARKFKKKKTKHLPLFHPLHHRKAFYCVDHNKLQKALTKIFFKIEYQIISTVSWEICMQVKKQQLEPCMEQQIGSRLRKEYDRAVCCHPVCLIYMLSTWREIPGWISYKLESRWVGETSTTSDMQMIPLKDTRATLPERHGWGKGPSD